MASNGRTNLKAGPLEGTGCEGVSQRFIGHDNFIFIYIINGVWSFRQTEVQRDEPITSDFNLHLQIHGE